MIVDAAGERSEQGRFLNKGPGSSNAVLGGSALRTRLDHRPKRAIHCAGACELRGNVRREENEVCPFSEAGRVLASNPFGEVVLWKHFFSHGDGPLPITSLLHRYAAQRGWRFER